MLGAGLLWFGWFGFNVGSALSLNDVALTAFINTNIAAAASALTWILSEWFFQSKPTAMGSCLWRRFRSSRYYTSLRVRYTFCRSYYRSDWRRIMLRAVFFLKQNSDTTIHSMHSDVTASAELGAELRQDYLQLLP